ncbi:hypothetical protein [Burkholderia sp. LMG 13014]|uniref:hypothetical protein n=1 Tax=Burkholderia sp. LMG 13014 TaxID=2709306 RepID=UPI0019633445|nr:hypothetical protein [Burkholderia sp. LMG 13014]
MTTTDNSRADALTAQEALAAIETFEIVGENNDSREPNDEDRFILTEFIAHAFDGYDVEQHEAAPAGTEPPRHLIDAAMDVARYEYGHGVTRASIVAIWKALGRPWAAPLEGTGNGADERAFPTTDGYFVYDRAGGHVEFYDTDAERDAAHREAIAEYRRDAMHDQEWPTEVEGIVSGVVTHTTGELEVHEDSYEFEPCAVTTLSRAPRTEVAGAVSEGWKLVPVAPTGNMLHAASIAARARKTTAELYAAMLAAAPTPPSADAAAAGQEAVEPVAWRYLTPTGWHATTDLSKISRVSVHHEVSPLYTAPPAQVATRMRPTDAITAVRKVLEANAVYFGHVKVQEIVDAALATRDAGLTDALRQAREELARVEWENDPPTRVIDLFSKIDALLEGAKHA